jgi:hypothetical protein
MFNNMKKRLTDQDFLNLDEDQMQQAMDQGLAPVDMVRDENYNEGLGEGVLPQVAKEQGFDDVEEMRNAKDSKPNTAMINAVTNLAKGAGPGPSVPSMQFQAPQMAAPRDTMAGMRKQVLKDIMSRR